MVFEFHKSGKRRVCAAFAIALVVGLVVDFAEASPDTTASPASSDDEAIAISLAQMLRAGRTVISSDQDLINDPNKGDKGLTGTVVLAAAVKIFRETTGSDPAKIDPKSRAGRLLHAQMDSIAEVMNANQQAINARGVGFKAFIPATFARLVNEAFARRVGEEASIKVTAPVDLVRNRKSLPDAWEQQIIETKFLTPGWEKGKPFEAEVSDNGHEHFRMMLPEYYAPSCLSCHGSPKGSIDITGYPREGGKEGDLGAVISVTLAH